MTTSESHFKFAFKIEEKPEGGFIARSEEPACTVEAATRAELEKKLEEKVEELLASDIAGTLQLGSPGVHVQKNVNFRFHVSRRTAAGESTDSSFTGSEPALASSTSDRPLQPESGFSRSTLVIVLIAVAILLALWLAYQR